MSVPTAPAVRIRPVPRSEPLTDCERGVGPSGAPGPSAVADRMLPPDLATGVRVRRGVRLRTAARAGTGVVAVVAPPLHTQPETDPAEEPAPHLAAELVTVVAPGLAVARGDNPAERAPAPGSREARLAARRLLGTCVEVIGGFRPIAHLRPYCAPERFDAIVNRLLRPTGAGRGHGATRSSVIARTLTPSKSGRPGRTPSQDRVTVRRVRMCEVSEGVAEFAVVMSRRATIWAMAMRMELYRGRWRCVHMEVL